MRMVAFYREQAARCWMLAGLMGSGKRRDRLCQIAREWDGYADRREVWLGREAKATAKTDKPSAKAERPSSAT